MNQYLERVVDLTDASANRLLNLSLDEARQRVLSGKPEAVREFEGSFAIVARDGKTVRMARSLDRPMRYFLAKRHEGPALIVADRIDAMLHLAFGGATLDDQLIEPAVELGDQVQPLLRRRLVTSLRTSLGGTDLRDLVELLAQRIEP